jgi:hypothetical protein
MFCLLRICLRGNVIIEPLLSSGPKLHNIKFKDFSCKIFNPFFSHSLQKRALDTPLLELQLEWYDKSGFEFDRGIVQQGCWDFIQNANKTRYTLLAMNENCEHGCKV